ncbi:MAG: AMP-binding protein, partial [Candidatus Magnetominusculus sp. LBB02]|nr:AMP-binding protein [Candidatus Magnetominusculus sp. LBB02]
FKAIQGQFGGQFRFIASGGARLRPQIMARLESYGFTVVEGYGLTETSPVVTFNPLDKRRPGSAGIPLKGVEISAPKKTGNAPPPEGEILIKGPMVFKGYLNMPDETAKTFTTDGWFRSGDLGYLDEDGYLFITGRSKEVIVLSSGKKVYPDDVEQAYAAIPLIKELCVYASERDTVGAVIVPNMDYARQMRIATVESAIKWELNKIATELPPYMRIKDFTLAAEPLPRTRLGKIKRFLVKAIVSSTAAAPEGDIALADIQVSDTYTAAVISTIKELMKLKRPVTTNETLELDLGIDSLTRLELQSALEERLKVRFPAGFGLDIYTVKELVDGVRAICEGGSAAANGDETQSGFKEMFNAAAPDADELKGVGLNNTFTARLFTRSVLWIIRQYLRRFNRGRLIGIENLPAPPYLISPNHTSYLDAFVVAALLPWEVFSKLYFQGAEDIFRDTPVREFVARLGHVIPIDPNVNLEKAMSMSAYLLRQGLSLCIFPEGARSVDGTLQEFKKGVGILSKECGVPVVPVRIDGAYEAMPRGAFWPKPAAITMRLGKPILPGDGTYQSISEEIKAAIAAMGN